jgi:hypothetical protein
MESCVVFPIVALTASSDFLTDTARNFMRSTYIRALAGCGPAIPQDLPCFAVYCHDVPFPLCRRVLQGCTPESSPLPWPSLLMEQLDSLCL